MGNTQPCLRDPILRGDTALPSGSPSLRGDTALPSMSHLMGKCLMLPTSSLACYFSSPAASSALLTDTLLGSIGQGMAGGVCVCGWGGVGIGNSGPALRHLPADSKPADGPCMKPVKLTVRVPGGESESW